METNGMIERFNRTLGVDLAKTVLAMETWPEYVAICVFRYNCSTHEATGQTPYKEMFGVESFEFDSDIDLRFRQDDEPANLSMRLAEVHKWLYDRSLPARTVAAKLYDTAVDETQYKLAMRYTYFIHRGCWRSDGHYRRLGEDCMLSTVSAVKARIC
jgi:hypothetical protein